MKFIKILFLFAFCIVFINSTSAVIVPGGEWISSSEITEGETASFNAYFGTTKSSMTINIKLFDSSNNLIKAFEKDKVINAHTFSKTYSIDESIYKNPGTFKVQIIGSDSDGKKTYTLTTLIINPAPAPNNSPILDSIGNKNIDENSLLEFSISGSDVDGDYLTYSASSLPTGASFNPSIKKFSWTPTFDQSGSYQITFTISDGTATDSETITIIVNNVEEPEPENNPPVITSTPITQVDEEDSYSYQVTATDADNDSLTYSLIQAPTWLSINSSTGLITGTAPPVNHNTNHNIKIKVSDGEDPVTQTYTLIVKNICQPPEPDTIPPVITLLGTNPVTIEVFSAYTDAGATAFDNVDGDITSEIIVINPVNVNILGTYIITYDVDDSSGNPATQVTRTVNVVDITDPVITLLGDNPQIIIKGDTYTELGATALDNYDGNLTSSVIINSSDVNTSTIGSYTVTYTVTDSSGNTVIVTRTVNVVSVPPTPDTIPPVITLLGTNPVTIEVFSAYVDAGATAFDNIDGDITSDIIVINPVNVNILGTYIITYDVDDSSGNPATQVTRTVNVVDTTPDPDKDEKPSRRFKVLPVNDEVIEEEYFEQYQPKTIYLRAEEEEELSWLEKLINAITKFFNRIF